MPIDNQEILRLLKQLKQSNISPRYYVLQFINLDRRYNSITGTLAINTSENENIKLFMDTFDQIQALLTSDVWCFLGSDSHNYNCHSIVKNHPNCVTWNPTFIDQAGVGTHPGIKWHKMLSLAITKKLQKQLM
jgi:hypothetical protein